MEMFLIPNLNCDLCCHRDVGSGRVRLAIVGPMSRSGPEENINFRGLNGSIFVIFFFTTPKISRGVHFLALEYPKMQCQQRTVRTTMRTTVHMNTGKVGATHVKIENNHILKKKV